MFSLRRIVHPAPTLRVRDSRIANAGFTLVELMVVVVIVGILGSVAVMSIDPDSRAGTARGYAEKVGARIEIARQRATATQKTQRIIIDNTTVTQWQGTTEGLDEPADWEFVYEERSGSRAEIFAASATVEVDPGSPPASGNIMPLEIDLLPDGRAKTAASTAFFEPGFTIYIQDPEGNRQVRVLVFGATGTTSVLENW